MNTLNIKQNNQEQSQSAAATTAHSAMASDETLVTAAEIQASSEIDNMSISEIIQQRFKKKVKEVKTPQEVASVIIKGPEDANLS